MGIKAQVIIRLLKYFNTIYIKYYFSCFRIANFFLFNDIIDSFSYTPHSLFSLFLFQWITLVCLENVLLLWSKAKFTIFRIWFRFIGAHMAKPASRFSFCAFGFACIMGMEPFLYLIRDCAIDNCWDCSSFRFFTFSTAIIRALCDCVRRRLDAILQAWSRCTQAVCVGVVQCGGGLDAIQDFLLRTAIYVPTLDVILESHEKICHKWGKSHDNPSRAFSFTSGNFVAKVKAVTFKLLYKSSRSLRFHHRLRSRCPHILPYRRLRSPNLWISHPSRTARLPKYVSSAGFLYIPSWLWNLPSLGRVFCGWYLFAELES